VSARAAGLAAELQVQGEVTTISPGLDLTAYRIVQEALTNAVKHAAPARATVSVGWGSDALELEVSDDGRRATFRNGQATGHGIPGMRERVALQGGSLELDCADGGGFRVRARLPLTGSAA
jgi:signal transduction histidine kinase